MGKVLREPKFSTEKYVVAIPNFERLEEPARAGELDARFAAPFREPDDLLDVPEEPASEATQAPVIDWEEVAAQADGVIDAAAQDARALLSQAAEQGRSLVAQAEQRVAEIEEQARTRGQVQGIAEGRAQIEAETTSLIATLRTLVEGARAERHTIVEGAEPELVRLAMAIAESIVHQQIALDPQVILENVRTALARLISREVVTLRVNPGDLETIRMHRDAIVAAHDVEHLRIVEDQRVDRGGVVLETEAGTIDAKISTQLREARKALQSDEAMELGSSGGEAILHTPAAAS